MACGPTSPDEGPLGQTGQRVTAPTKAYCTIKVTGKGTLDLEGDYLPHVIQCENGGANLQALKAQAIAARSVAYYAIATSGSICDGQGCQVYSCGATPNAKQKQAVDETRGIILSHAGLLTYGFFVAGDSNTSAPSCHGVSGSTEKYVTYNEGKSGTSVTQTTLGYVGPPGYGQNRGCMGQWGARCLENSKSYDYKGILRFYYGDDIGMPTMQGSCVPTGSGGSTGTGGSGGSGGTGGTSGTGGTGGTGGAGGTGGTGGTGGSSGTGGGSAGVGGSAGAAGAAGGLASGGSAGTGWVGAAGASAGGAPDSDAGIGQHATVVGDQSGCACRAGSAPDRQTHPLGLMLVLVALGFARRSRRE